MKAHENQITDYPKGARIEAIREILLCSPTQNYYANPLPQGTRGTVTAHTDDGRAWINFDGQGQGLLGHTFEQPEKYIRVVCTHRDDNCPANHDQISSTSDDAPAAPERGEWASVPYSASEVEVIGPKELHICFLPNTPRGKQIASQIATEHNQHFTLITQREQLAQAAQSVIERLKDLPRYLKKNASLALASITAEALADLAAAIPAEVITTSEQEGRR